MSWRSLLTWWQEDTLGTRLFTWRKGERVGTDTYGNRYFRERNGPRRWVLFNGDVEASKVPPLWHAWLHYTSDDVPDDNQPGPIFEKSHAANLTGTPEAYRPPGHVSSGGRRDRATGDYEPWRPS